MIGFRTPNFRGRHALVLHRSGEATGRLTRQLERLGMQVEWAWPEFPASGEYADVVFFDADNGFDGLFPWLPGEAPMPLIALLGSELPGRLEWALSQSLCAHVMKPIQSSGVFSALVIAFSNFEAVRDGRRVTDDLQLRLGGRAAVIRAVVGVMKAGGIDDDEAYARIRSAAMSRRITVEDFCSGLGASIITELAREMPRVQERRPGK
ncbi:MAG: ANTAR domain-containing response regulator [Alphaproteobacteria bacterium]